MFKYQSLKLKGLRHALLGLNRLAGLWAGVTQTAAHIQTGLAGERASYFHLRRAGYTVVAERFKASGIPGDIDLIAWHHGTLCFIEVKTRTSKEVAHASLAVDRHKRAAIRRLARQYLIRACTTHNGLRRPETRFDVICIYRLPGMAEEVELMKGSFGWSERRQMNRLTSTDG